MSEAEKLTLPFGDLDRTMLPIAGGKAANLGELARAGLPVPDGFCLTTAAYELVAEGADLDQNLNDLAGTDPEDTSRLAELAAAARASLSEASVPDDLVEAITRAYRELGNGGGSTLRELRRPAGHVPKRRRRRQRARCGAALLDLALDRSRGQLPRLQRDRPRQRAPRRGRAADGRGRGRRHPLHRQPAHGEAPAGRDRRRPRAG